MKVNFNVLNRGYYKFQNEYNNAVISALESGWYILGKEVESFERNFKGFIGSNHAVGVNSGLDALILALRALNIKNGDEVIVPANTYIATVLAITENGATPIFVEPDAYYNLDAQAIEAKISETTKAIMVVHLYGQTAKMDALKAVADKHDLYLVEDCAQSHGSKFNGQTSGTFGDVGCFSFYPTKNIGAFGDGGAIVTDNKDIADKVRMLRNYGSKIKYHNEVQGINSRLDEIQAALLNVKLSHYNELREERAVIAKKYLDEIDNPKITLPKIRKNADTVWHLFVIRTDNRDSLQKYLSEQGIGTQIHYPIPPHLSQAYENLGYKQGDFPITEQYAETALSLPLYDGMTFQEAEYVIQMINKF